MRRCLQFGALAIRRLQAVCLISAFVGPLKTNNRPFISHETVLMRQACLPSWLYMHSMACSPLCIALTLPSSSPYNMLVFVRKRVTQHTSCSCLFCALFVFHMHRYLEYLFQLRLQSLEFACKRGDHLPTPYSFNKEEEAISQPTSSTTTATQASKQKATKSKKKGKKDKKKEDEKKHSANQNAVQSTVPVTWYWLLVQGT